MGTHSKVEPRAIRRNWRFSALCQRPLPSAMLREIERDARVSWSMSDGDAFVRRSLPRDSTVLAQVTAFL